LNPINIKPFGFCRRLTIRFFLTAPDNPTILAENPDTDGGRFDADQLRFSGCRAETLPGIFHPTGSAAAAQRQGQQSRT
jgi:hypothetical protein